MSGWFAVKRGTIEHELFAPVGKWSRLEAWLWMVESAAFRPTTIDIGGKPYVVPRGALCFSQRFLAEKFGWSKKGVTTFLDKLQAHGAIEITVAKTGNGTKAKRTQITLCNYDKYQHDGTKTEPKRDQKGTKEEQVTIIPVGANASAPPDLKKIVFGQGLDFLVQSGVVEKHARSKLGQWVKIHGEPSVIDAVSRAQKAGAIEPVSFIEGIFKHKAKTSDPEMHGAFGRIKEVG